MVGVGRGRMWGLLGKVVLVPITESGASVREGVF